MIDRQPATRALMLQGTGSDVGKSLIVAGLGRLFARRGLRVRPFKPQNMSNNAAVTEDGGEIGRAQSLQARACGVAPAVDMNPVLLKPQGEGVAQIVVEGRVYATVSAREYRRLAPTLLARVVAAFERLCGEADLVLIEGAGSPAEINLRNGDIANMGFAEAADVPVVLIGDIERGGVIAQLVGTCVLLSAAERGRLAGYIVNKFRGDPRLFDGGIAAVGERTGLPCFGVVPHFGRAALLPAEDTMALAAPAPHPLPLPAGGEREEPSPEAWEGEGPRLRIAVPVCPRIANFDDLDPLRAEPSVDVVLVQPGRPIPRDTDIVLLPGSKATLADLAFLKQQGWDIDIRAHHRQGGHVLGLCGGYQMLGRTIADPQGCEGPPGEAAGLGLLPVDTVLSEQKTLSLVSGVDLATGEPVSGYEMHLGVTTGAGLAQPMLRLGDRDEGAVSRDGRVAGCYLHGLFTADGFRRAFLARRGVASTVAYDALVEDVLDALADHLAAALDIDRLLAAARPPRFTPAL